jgi:hypothetical protein
MGQAWGSYVALYQVAPQLLQRSSPERFPAHSARLTYSKVFDTPPHGGMYVPSPYDFSAPAPDRHVKACLTTKNRGNCEVGV